MVAGSPLVAAVGAGIMVTDGIIWVDESIENYAQKYAREYGQAREQSETYARANQQYHSQFLSSQLAAQATASLYEGVVRPGTPRQRYAQQQPQVLQQGIMRAQAALADVKNSPGSPAELERQRLHYALKYAIFAVSSILPVPLIQEAIAALDGSPERLEEMLARLQAARQQYNARLSAQELARLQLEELLAQTQAQLETIAQVLPELSAEQQARFAQQFRAIQSILPGASAQGLQTTEALENAQRAQNGSRALIEAVSNAFLEERISLNSLINQQLGVLETLSEMLKEAGRGPVKERREWRELADQIQELHYHMQSLLEQPLSQAEQQFTQQNRRLSLLKEQTFTLIETLQQQVIADTIAETLQELHFQATPGDQGLIRARDTLLRVVASPSKQSAQNKRDDRVVTFEIARNGDITYDFVGYTGDSCLTEAETIFAALREKGLHILDQNVARRMREAVARGQRVDAQMLQRPEYQHHPLSNKLQAQMAERLLSALGKMQFEHIEQQVVGGVIELDAFNGDVGYHAQIRAEGTVEVTRNEGEEEVKIEADSYDPLAIEARQVRLEHPPAAEKASPAKHQQTLPKRVEQKLREP